MKSLSRTTRSFIVAAATLVIAACAGDNTPTAPSAAPESSSVMIRRAPRMDGWTLPASGTTSNGGTFAGTVAVKRFDVNANRELVVTGTLTGVVTNPDGTTSTVSQSFVQTGAFSKTSSASTAAARADATEVASASSLASCDILFLDLGPLHLDVLGLTVDLAEVVLDVNAVAGGGNLLGNLLCAVVGLFDGVAFLAAIQNLLDLINGIIGGI